ncbi:MAG: SAF domain-containing protein [Nitriliruptoraceae bacterium]
MTGVVVVETTTLPGSPATRPEPGPARRVRPVRGLPNGRAVVGALLIVAAAVATFVAYLDATSAPVTRYVVATAAVEPGTRLTSLEVVGERFGTIALDLPPEVAGAVVPGGEVEELVGQMVLAPLAPGDVLSRSHLVEDGRSAGVQSLSFALPRWSAVGGSLRAGERIDVLATYGAGEAAYTAFVVRGVPLLGVAAPDGGSLADAGEVTLTVAVSALEDVQALAHAVSTAELLVTRSAADSDRATAPGAYRPHPTVEGPRPDPATVGDGRQDD